MIFAKIILTMRKDSFTPLHMIYYIKIRARYKPLKNLIQNGIGRKKLQDSPGLFTAFFYYLKTWYWYRHQVWECYIAKYP